MAGALDIENHSQLEAYLRASGRLSPTESIQVRTLAGGVSNRTVLVERSHGAPWVLKQALPRLRVATEWLSDPARIRREALGLQWLPRLTPAGSIPGYVFLDEAANVLAMEAVPEPHANWKSMLLAGEVDLPLVDQFGAMLGRIHREAWTLRLELEPLFREQAFFETLRLEPYYGYTASQVASARFFLHGLIAETRATRLTLVHGDYSPKNVLVRSGRLVLLDHEVIHWGDPAFDVGFALTHLLSKAHHVAAYRAQFLAAARRCWQAYAGDARVVPWWDALGARIVRHTLACLLARVAGRSPLEYLGAEERRRQQAVVLELISDPPSDPAKLINAFTSCLSSPI